VIRIKGTRNSGCLFSISLVAGFGAMPQGLSPRQVQVPFRRNGITCYTILTMGVFCATLVASVAQKYSRGIEKKSEWERAFFSIP